MFPFLILRDDVTKADVIDFLNSDEAVLKYGLTVKEAKCWWMSQQKLKEVGVEILGSWVGDPVGSTEKDRAARPSRKRRRPGYKNTLRQRKAFGFTTS